MKVFCFGILPIIVSTPDGDIKVILSPILRSKLKLSSLPIDIEFLINFDLVPLNFSFFIIAKLEKSLLSYPLRTIPFDDLFFNIIASPELLKIIFSLIDFRLSLFKLFCIIPFSS